RGLKVNLHKDAPDVKSDMLHTIWFDDKRITKKGVEIGPKERIYVYDDLKAQTINVSYAYFEEDQKGTITIGNVADLVIFDKNPLKEDKMTIKDLHVLETIKTGKSIYRKADKDD